MHPTAATHRRNGGRRQHEVPPLRQRGIGKTSADKTSTRRPPENISKTSRRRHENHRQRRGCAGETRALAVRSDRWSLALRRSAAHEPPAAREPPQQASLLEHEGHQRNAIYRANSARQARRTPQDSPRAKSILNSRGSLSAFRRAGPIQGWPRLSRLAARACESPQDSWKNSPSSEPVDLMTGKGLRAD